MSSPPVLQSPVVSAPMRRAGWIISPLCDTAFFLVPPLLGLIVAAFVDLSRFNSAELGLMLLAAVAAGHHIPGFIRAYSDPEVMRRYRGRMILGPLLLIAAALICEVRQIPGMRLIMIVWGVWHLVMQNYGLLRIYGAKTGGTTGISALLDWLVLTTWISAVYLNNTSWSYGTLWYVYMLGCPILPTETFSMLGTLSLIAATFVSCVYVCNELRWAQGGRPFSVLKYVLLVENVLFFALAFSLTTSFLIVTVIVELVHDIQYYAIGWMFQLRLAEKRGAENSAIRWLFRPTLGMLLGYLAMCLTYGILISDYGRTYLYPKGMLFQITSALQVAAVIFHFYSDGFIWKVRQPQVRQCLGIDEVQGKAITSPMRETAWKRSLLHLACYAATVALMVWAHGSRSNRNFEIASHLAHAFPQLSGAHYNLGLQFQNRNHHASAISELLLASQLGVPDSIELQQRLAISFESLGQYDKAVDLLREAVAAAPPSKFPPAASQLALLLAECPALAIRNATEAVRLAELTVPESGSMRPYYLDVLAACYQSAGRTDDARETALLALQQAQQLNQAEIVQRISVRLLQINRSNKELQDAVSGTTEQ